MALMYRSIGRSLFLLALMAPSCNYAHEGTIDRFPLAKSELRLERLAQPGTPFDKVGRKFAILGFESGSFEAWAYPVKLFRQFEFSFFLGSSTRPVEAHEIVRYVDVEPEKTTLTLTYQSFTVKAHFITPVNEPGAFILLEVNSTESMTIVCSFLPVLQPMWPGGIGGQYAYWNDELKAYIISEPTRSYHGIIGSPAASGLSYTPAHMLSDSPNEFKIEIDDPDRIRDKFIPILMAGGMGKREDVIDLYKTLTGNMESFYLKAREHYGALLKNTLQIYTPSKEVNLAFEWAKVAYDNLIVDNPDLGKGLVAGLAASGMSGRPGFGWFFGGDTYINAFSLNAMGAYQTVRDGLEFMVQFQRDDGKMAHEISQAAGTIDWFGSYPYGYIHGDTSPFFVVAVYDYLKMTGDRGFVRKHWESIRRAYEWSLATDENADGLMDNRKAGLGALEYGRLAGGIATDIYIGAVWVKAAQAVTELARAAGKTRFARDAERQAAIAIRAFREKFWDDEEKVYAYAFNADGDRVKEFSPWSAVGLMWGFGEDGRVSQTLERISSSELMTDWGVRSISNQSTYFQALNYNYGAVWPFLNSWVATALFKNHFLQQGYTTLMSTVRSTFTNQLGAIGEVFSGTIYTWPQESVAHQGFSTAGAVLPLVRGLFGMDGDALRKTVLIAPHFPADWHRVRAGNIRIGDACFDVEFQRQRGRLNVTVKAENAHAYRFKMAPAFGIGTRIGSVRIDDEDHPFDVVEHTQVVQPVFSFGVTREEHRIEIVFESTVEILPYTRNSRVGDSNIGLKIIAVRKNADGLVLECEGRMGMTYLLRTWHADSIRGVEGAEWRGEMIEITFPGNEAGGFVRKRVTIQTH